MAKKLGNILGAFSDGAILFPLIAALAQCSGFSSAVLFVSTGFVYILAGIWFRIPMPVQPLKAIAIAAVVSGASYLEVRWAGAIVGALCVCLLVLRVDKMADRVPSYLVHGIQAGLGVMLLRRAFEIGWDIAPHLGSHQTFIILGACLFCWLVSHLTGLSLLGLLAAGGTLVGIARTSSDALITAASVHSVRWEIVLVLALPQIVLTSANSVLATHDVAHRYFGERARKVTISGLLGSIGFGNLIVSAFGGLPFCHGSGGMTAHVRGGSNHCTSNLVIGTFLVGLAVAQLFWGKIQLRYPPLLLAILLGVVGFYHVRLAAPSWKTGAYRATLFAMGSVALISQNLLWALACGIFTATLSFFHYSKRAAI